MSGGSIDADALSFLAAGHAEEHHVPGVAWGVVRGGALVAAGGHGVAQAGGTEPMGPATVSRIASMTKSFTAAAVLHLRDAGRLRLDDEVAAIVPEVGRWRLPTTDAPAVTIRHVLTMSAGTATDDAWGDRHLDLGPGDLSAVLADVVFADGPGLRFEYSNLGYALLGRVVEAVSGERYQAYAAEHLLGPLGMGASGYAPPAGPGRAEGSRWVDDHWEPEPALGDGGLAAMGGLWSTVEDLARWVAWWLDAFPSRDGPDPGPLRRASRREAQQAQRSYPMEREPGDDTGTGSVAGGYGFGLRVVHHPELGHVVMHSGGLPGFGSQMRWLPERGIGVIALGNVTYAPMGRLCGAMVRSLLASGALPEPAAPDGSLVQPLVDRLVAALREGDLAAAADSGLFADNVEPDEPFSRRAAAARALGSPTWAIESVTPSSRTSATARLVGGAVPVLLAVQLAPTPPARVQWWELTPEEPAASGDAEPEGPAR